MRFDGLSCCAIRAGCDALRIVRGVLERNDGEGVLRSSLA
jgi:hypothetical protein